MATSVYMLTVFYSDAEKQAKDLAKIKPIVDGFGTSAHPVQFDGRTTAYMFTSNLDYESIQSAFKPVMVPKIQILIVELAGIVWSNIPTHTPAQYLGLLKQGRK